MNLKAVSDWIKRIGKTVYNPEKSRVMSTPGYINLNIFTAEAVGDWNGNGKSNFCQVAKNRLAKKILQDVRIHIPHGKNHRLINDSYFHIFIWSSPPVKSGGLAQAPQKLWDIDVDSRDAGFGFSGMGKSINYQGYSVAELIDNCLYIHHDVCHAGSRNELKIFALILDETVKALELPEMPENYDDHISWFFELKRKKNDRLRSGYIRLAIMESEDRQKEALKIQEAYTKSINEIGAELTETVELVNNKKDELIVMEESLEEISAKHAATFERIAKNKMVKDILEVNTKRISILTNKIYSDDSRSGKTHDIGSCRIDIYINGENGGLIITNQTRCVDGYMPKMQAPNVLPNGQPFDSNIKLAMPELIAKYMFDVVIANTIKYLENVKVNNIAGMYIDKWPEGKRPLRAIKK